MGNSPIRVLDPEQKSKEQLSKMRREREKNSWGIYTHVFSQMSLCTDFLANIKGFFVRNLQYRHQRFSIPHPSSHGTTWSPIDLHCPIMLFTKASNERPLNLCSCFFFIDTHTLASRLAILLQCPSFTGADLP